MPVSYSSRGASGQADFQGAAKALESGNRDAWDQQNSKTQLIGAQNGKLPNGAPPGSLATWTDSSAIYFSVAGPDRNFASSLRVSRAVTLYTGLTTTALPPTTTELPKSGSFGWHLDTNTGAYYWALNNAGTIVYPNFLGITGTISTLQHGDLSTAVATFHTFAQITGTITIAQHGDMSGGATTDLHKFAQINGVITDTQHGARGNISGTAHDVVVASGNAGFMSGADKAKLNNYPADCTTVYNDSNAVQRNAGAVNGLTYRVNGTKVVDSQYTYTQSTFTIFTGVDNDGPCRSRVAELITALSHHGLIV